MQPKTSVTFDKKTFDRLKRTVRNISRADKALKGRTPDPFPLPDEVGIQLTNKCNLRCKHCFQWNYEGFHHSMETEDQSDEIEPDLVEKILRETASVKSNLYLWGGEPLSYSHLAKVTELLEKDPRWTVFCTNGVNLGLHLDSLLRISPYLALLISLEGFEAENDAIRGKGVYRRVVDNIRYLLDLKKRGIFKGEISVNCVINELLVGRMYEFAEEMEGLGINSLYYCFPWYISQGSAEAMDRFYAENFSWLGRLNLLEKPSWYSYTHRFNPEMVPALMQDIERLRTREWKIRLRLQPALEDFEVEGFLDDDGKPGQGRRNCLGIQTRMNVMPGGGVTVCKLFPEFEIGNLRNSSVSELWNSPEFLKVREVVGKGLMPVCSKCILLYLHGR